jgi:hypothetical protein
MKSIDSNLISISRLIFLVLFAYGCKGDKSIEPVTSIVINPTLLSFSSIENDTLPDEKTFNISNGGVGTLEWLIIDTTSWLDATPMSGVSNNVDVQVSVNTTSMVVGTHNSIIGIVSGNAENSPRQLIVSYVINQVPVIGSWAGIYRVITGFQSPTADTTWSTIEMLFSDESYFFNSDNNPDAFCDPRGDFSFSGASISFTETNKNCTQIASEFDNPRGMFSLTMPSDSLLMNQLVADTLKEFYLKRQ